MPERQYPDLPQHLRDLDEVGLLWTVDDGINRDKHLHPFVRRAYVGTPAGQDRIYASSLGLGGDFDLSKPVDTRHLREAVAKKSAAPYFSAGLWVTQDPVTQRATDGDWQANGARTERLVDTDSVGGPTSGVPRKHVVVYNESDGTVTYPDGFPCVDDFSTDD